MIDTYVIIIVVLLVIVAVHASDWSPQSSSSSVFFPTADAAPALTAVSLLSSSSLTHTHNSAVSQVTQTIFQSREWRRRRQSDRLFICSSLSVCVYVPDWSLPLQHPAWLPGCLLSARLTGSWLPFCLFVCLPACSLPFSVACLFGA